MLRSTGRSRERICLYGLEGTGKSLAALDIASRIKPKTLYVIDNDNAWDRMVEGLTIAGESVGVLEELRWEDTGWVDDDRWCVDDGNVVVYHADGWDANTSALDAVMKQAGPDDWLCIDSGSALWDDVQAWFTEKVFGSSIEEYFLQVRLEKQAAAKDAKALGALDGWVDWPVINAQYKKRVMVHLVNPRCHLIVTCEQADITRDETDKETRALYGGQQVKPRGQKRLGHNVQTVLRLGRQANGNFTATTVKDRGGRERLELADVTDEGFAEWYLTNIAGWTEEQQVPVAKKIVSKS